MPIGEKLDDFFSALTEDINGAPHHLEREEVIAEIGIVSKSPRQLLRPPTNSIQVNAGSDTTAVPLTNVVYHLVKTPHRLSILQTELSTDLDPTDTIAPYDEICHLTYPHTCLDGSLRLTPPIAFGLMRKSPPQGAGIADHFYPGGIAVSMAAYAAHRDPSIFPNLEAFEPERWLGEKGKKLQSYLIVFSGGVQGFIGRNTGYLAQSVLLATVLNLYGIALENEGWEIRRR
jgi:cytochrome P450